MLHITKAGKRKYVALGVSVEERHWDFEKNKPKRNCPNKELIEKLKSAQQPVQGMTTQPILDTNEETPIPTGKGYGALQRAINETGVVQ